MKLPIQAYILVLDDSHERAERFATAAAELGPWLTVHVWHDVAGMLAEINRFIDETVLISLDHDHAPNDPKTGMDIVKWLANRVPACSVIVHTSNTDASWSMMRELQDAGWNVVRAAPVGMGEDWIESVWLPAAKRIISTYE